MPRAKRLAQGIGVLLLTLHFVMLHRSDGGDVIVNAEQVTSLRTPAGKLEPLAPHARCLVGLTDGRFVGVLETCAEVKQQLEGR